MPLCREVNLLTKNAIPAKPAQIFVSGVFDVRMSNYFCSEMSRALNSGTKIILIWIDSPGGRVDCLDKMLCWVEHAKDSGVTVATIVYGQACSCGSILAAMGTFGHRYIGKNGKIMIHMISGGSEGTEIVSRMISSRHMEGETLKRIHRNVSTNTQTWQQTRIISSDRSP